MGRRATLAQAAPPFPMFVFVIIAFLLLILLGSNRQR